MSDPVVSEHLHGGAILRLTLHAPPRWKDR